MNTGVQARYTHHRRVRMTVLGDRGLYQVERKTDGMEAHRTDPNSISFQVTIHVTLKGITEHRVLIKRDDGDKHYDHTEDRPDPSFPWHTAD